MVTKWIVFFIIQAMDFRNGFVVLAYLSTPDNIKVLLLIIYILNHGRMDFYLLAMDIVLFAASKNDSLW